MTRQAIIAVVVGVIIVLGAAAAFLYSRTSQPTETANTTANQEESTNEEAMKLSSIVDIFSKGDTATCSFSTSEADASGTIYVSGDNARGDFEATIDGKTEASHMIRNGDTFYMWGDSLATGIKMVTSVNEWADEAQSSEATTFDPNSQVDFKCSAWTVDSSMFTAPTDINFISLEGTFGPDTATLKEAEDSESSAASDAQNQCSICNALSGEAKNVCLEQFNCQ